MTRMSFLMKGIYFIVILMVIAIVINQIVTLNLRNIKQWESVSLRDKSKNILETLAGNKNCLAYEEVADIEGIKVNLASHKILDVNKLNDFVNNFAELEPDCVRDFEYGYRVKIETFPINMTKPLNIFMLSESWSFGDLIFSREDALGESVKISIPVIVLYNSTVSIPGKMTITLVKGELEKLVGFIEQSCLTERSSTTSLYLHYPTQLEIEDGKSKVCMEIGGKKRCQTLACEKEIDFHGNEIAGNYKIYSSLENDILKIMI